MTPLPVGETVGKHAPFDTAVDTSQLAAGPPRRRWPYRRLALGLSPMPRSGLLLLIVGMALGPYGLHVLSEQALALLDPAVSVALAAVGVLVGLEVRVRPSAEGRLIAVASLDAAATILVVGIGMVLVLRWSVITLPTPWLLAFMLGICAAPSSTPADVAEDERQRLAARVGDLDDVLPIVLSALAIVWMPPGTPKVSAWLLAQGGLLAVAMAFAVRLLVTQTSSENEQRVFVIGALLLLGGSATYLSLSALFAGLAAGVFWNITGAPARDHIARDVRLLQHPLTVLLLVVAGARVEFTGDVLGLVVAYVVLRIAAKLVSGWVAARLTHELPRRFGLFLSAPGVVGIAIALNVLQARGGAGATIFAIVIAGLLGAELFSLLLGPRQDALE